MPDDAPKPSTPARPSGGLGDLVKAESMVQLALAVPAGCFVGLLLGAALDRHFHKHWMAVFFMLLGSAGGFIQIFTSLARSSKRGDDSSSPRPPAGPPASATPTCGTPCSPPCAC